MSHPLRCGCGQMRGLITHPESGTRGVCYCKDCQAFARFLGKPDDILDGMRGTDIVAILPQYVSFTQGFDKLACMSLTAQGTLRWYAGCCNTPICNTPRNFKLAHVGLVHSCLRDPAISLDDSFGPVRMRVNRQSARDNPPAMPLRTFAAVLRYAVRLARARLTGGYRITPFFNPVTGVPVRLPRALAPIERDRFRNVV